MSASLVYRSWNLHRLQQSFKWIVYFLLVVNFGFYLADDLSRALLTQNQDSTIWQWVREFATSIDESAWFILIIMLELETYVLEDRHLGKGVRRTLRAVRLGCCVMIAYAIFAFGQYAFTIAQSAPVANVSNLCEFADTSADTNIVFTKNLEYTEVAPDTCDQLSSDTTFFFLGDEALVTDSDGLALERRLAWADVVEVTVWVLIIALMEVVIRLQDRGIGRGALISGLSLAKTAGYGLLLALGAWWATLGHWLYLWDEILWVGGFAAIEMNLSEWRGEMEDAQSGGVESATGAL